MFRYRFMNFAPLPNKCKHHAPLEREVCVLLSVLAAKKAVKENRLVTTYKAKLSCIEATLRACL
ncbi:hypothetical protein MPC1_12750002 [Methylocella tundrae]|nr:hypothetical protein MPC1_12750002 [Methylocella tundrae]